MQYLEIPLLSINEIHMINIFVQNYFALYLQICIDNSFAFLPSQIMLLETHLIAMDSMTESFA